MYLRACSSVDRALDSDPSGRGFNSLHAQVLNLNPKKM